MPSDLTAAAEAAKRVATQQRHTQKEEAEVAQALLDLTSQPLYRRRKDFAKWVQRSSETFEWRDYRVGFLLGSWQAIRVSDWTDLRMFNTQELAQAACEAHFWEQLERDVVERVN